MRPWWKRDDLCPKKKFYNSNPKAVTEPEVSKNAKQCFFMTTHQKRPKNAKLWRTCQTPFFHAKQLLKRPNFRNLAVKMPTWQSWSKSKHSPKGFSYCDFTNIAQVQMKSKNIWKMQPFHNKTAHFFSITPSKSGPDPKFWRELYSGSNTNSRKFAIVRIQSKSSPIPISAL